MVMASGDGRWDTKEYFMGYVIGCDLGSQSAKAVLMSPEGGIVATASAGYAMAHPHSGWAEQDPAHYRHGIASSSRGARTATRFPS